MDEIAGVARHCETLLPNHNCPYLALGCLGCTLSFRVPQGALEWRSQLIASMTITVTAQQSK